jgi:hypothetical protein
MSQPPWEWGAPHYRGGHDQRRPAAAAAVPPVCPGCRAELGSRTALVDHHKQHAEALLDELSSIVEVGTEGYSAGWACRLRVLLRSPLIRRFLREGEGTPEQHDTTLRRVHYHSDPLCRL